MPKLPEKSLAKNPLSQRLPVEEFTGRRRDGRFEVLYCPFQLAPPSVRYTLCLHALALPPRPQATAGSQRAIAAVPRPLTSS